MPDVFVSYNRQDQETAQRIASALKDEGLDVWWDAALRAGEAYDEVTERNLRDAGAVVVLWSPRSVNSKWVRAEATVGERSTTLVPALIEDCDRPLRFELVQTADLRHWRGDRSDSSWRLFVLDIKEAVAKRRAAPPAASGAAASDASIETAFWTSIKDSRDAAEFEAYLGRYPKGHFADLAKSRLANLARSPKGDGAPQNRPAAPHAEASRPRPAAQPAARPRESAGGVNPFMAGAALIAVAAFVGGMFFLMNRKPAESAAAAEPVEKAATSEPASPPPVEVASAKLPPAPEPPAALPDKQAEPASTPAERPVSAPPPTPAPQTDPTYTDCSDCPTMRRLPGGVFKMGSPPEERGRNPWEGPQHEVTIAPFAIAASETTEAQWAACVADRACTAKRSNGGPDLPVLGVNWRDANAYAAWLSKKTGKTYRLPTEAEWEYAARGGTETAYPYGARFVASNSARGGPRPAGSVKANGFGLFNMSGNAREWVEDCYVNNFTATPTDGSANRSGDCAMRVIRDGTWSAGAADLRVANRGRLPKNTSASYVGFRVAGPPR